ncbi:MAG: hypothetical protein IT280_11020 [Ignavibacteria bacterium]|nr:hypothetical protein [Ignavibacteria bacterium]
MKSKFAVFFGIGAGLIAGLLLILIIFQLLGFTYHEKVIMELVQGEYIKYNSYDPYKLRIIKQYQPLGSKVIVMVSRSGDDSYGHVINYIDTAPVSEDDIKLTRVIWNNEGIEMTFPLGHKLYIPKECFTGGR